MKRGEIVGYVVISDSRPQVLTDYGDGPRGGVLAHGDCGHLFATRTAANRAITRTLVYSDAKNLGWPRVHSVYALRRSAS